MTLKENILGPERKNHCVCHIHNIHRGSGHNLPPRSLIATPITRFLNLRERGEADKTSTFNNRHQRDLPVASYFERRF